MRTKITLLLALLLIVVQSKATDPEAKIIAQQNAPVEITSYSAVFRTGTKYSSEGIVHSITYKNTSERTVAAMQFGLVSFDIWNEFLDRTGGITIEDVAPGGTDKGSWRATAYADFTFLTGFAYVSKVRFSDGEIWIADLEAIAEEMRKIEQDFDVQKLEEDTANK